MTTNYSHVLAHSVFMLLIIFDGKGSLPLVDGGNVQWPTLANYLNHFDTLRSESAKNVWPFLGQISGSSFRKSFVLSLRAYNRTFNIEPTSNFKPIFAPSAVVVVRRKRYGKNPVKIPVDHFSRNYIYGRLDDDWSSVVHGTLTGMVFEGVIRTLNETLHVETVSDPGKKSVPLSIMYRVSDVGCHGRASKAAAPVQSGDRDSCPVLGTDRLVRVFGLESRMPPLDFRGFLWRQLTAGIVQNGTLRVCSLKVVCDQSFFHHVGNDDVYRTVEEVQLHVREVNAILGDVDFDGDGRPDSYRLSVSEVEVLTDASPFDPSVAVNSSDFLEAVARMAFGDCCLGIALTFRTFADGAVSASHVASPSYLLPGGICTPPADLRSVHPNRSELILVNEAVHLNTGVLSFSGVDGLVRVPRAATVDRLAQLVTHLMGSGHRGHSRALIPLPGCETNEEPEMAVNAPLSVALPGRWRPSRCAVSQMHAVLQTKGGCLLPDDPRHSRVLKRKAKRAAKSNAKMGEPEGTVARSMPRQRPMKQHWMDTTTTMPWCNSCETSPRREG